MFCRLFLGLLPLVALAQQPPYLNLGFETNFRGFLWGWSRYTPGYEAAPDAGTVREGTQSLRIRWVSASGSAFANISQNLPPELFRGKHLRFTCYIRSQGITRGTAQTWLRADGPGGILFVDNSAGPTGDTDWAPYTIERDISPEATVIYFGMLLTGDGAGWFDDVRLEVDGVPFVPGPSPPGEPTAAQVNWIRAASNPFYSEQPGGDLGDLWPAKGMVGDAHVVGLGEGTHGSAEFFHMKHRLLQYLVTEMGFTVFAIEAGQAEAAVANDLSCTGAAPPARR